MRAKRGFTTFSLSFIDCMSCGLGAVVLLFMIINHATEVRAVGENREVADKVSRLESEVLEKRQQTQKLAAALQQAEDQTEAAKARAAQLDTAVQAEDKSKQGADARQQRIAELRSELKSLDGRVQALREQAESGAATRSYTGEGDRQYLTGMKVGGRRILILVDASASMLAEQVVSVIRRRNMSRARKLASPKWRRAVDTVDWITTQVPPDARFQMYVFNTEARPVLEGTDGQWQSTDNGRRLTAAVQALRGVVPEAGTSLERAFAAAGRLSPKPDNIYLLTDGLPTQGTKPRKGTVSGRQRLELYRQALDALPGRIPINVILFPIEGDPMAASMYWQLAQASGGSFLSPSRDWP